MQLCVTNKIVLFIYNFCGLLNLRTIKMYKKFREPTPFGMLSRKIIGMQTIFRFKATIGNFK